MGEKRHAFYSEYALGDRVHADGDKSMRLLVAELSWMGDEPLYRVTWFNGGVHQELWLRAWRLSLADPDDNADGHRGSWPTLPAPR